MANRHYPPPVLGGLRRRLKLDTYLEWLAGLVIAALIAGGDAAERLVLLTTAAPVAALFDLTLTPYLRAVRAPNDDNSSLRGWGTAVLFAVLVAVFIVGFAIGG